jgi:hypothetical protein
MIEMPKEIKEIPLNISDFEYIREHGCLYVDKTKYIELLLDSKDKYFLMLRPKRFGKSLFLNTLAAFFSGQEELFRGLYIHDKVESFEKFPVIKLNMSVASTTPEVLIESITSRLLSIANDVGIELRYESNPSEALFWLIRDMRKQFGKKVVVLVDEYEKSVVDHIFDEEAGEDIRRILHDFYLVLKESEPYLHFIYMTGIVKLAQSAMISYINNVTDLTFLDEFSTAFGYTREEYIAYFSNRLEPLMDIMSKNDRFISEYSIVDLRNDILDYYDVYSWNGKNKVFSPYLINRYFYLGGPKNLWFKTDTPVLLQSIIQDDVDSFVSSTFQNYPYDQLCNIDLCKVNPVAMLFFYGYLTVDKVYLMNGKYFYNFKIQNYENNHEFCKTLYDLFFTHKTQTELDLYMKQIIYAIRTKNAVFLEALLSDLIFTIPMIEAQKYKFLADQFDFNIDERIVDNFPSWNYDYFDITTNKTDPENISLDVWSSEGYRDHVVILRNHQRFNLLFQIALQAMFDRHGFLTKPEILRANRDIQIDCFSKFETYLFKVTNVIANGKTSDDICRILCNEAKTGLEYISNQTNEEKFSNLGPTVHKISIAIHPFDKIKVALAP